MVKSHRCYGWSSWWPHWHSSGRSLGPGPVEWGWEWAQNIWQGCTGPSCFHRNIPTDWNVKQQGSNIYYTVLCLFFMKTNDFLLYLLILSIVMNDTYVESGVETASAKIKVKVINSYLELVYILKNADNINICEPCHKKTLLCYMWTRKAQMSLLIREVWSAPLFSLPG